MPNVQITEETVGPATPRKALATIAAALVLLALLGQGARLLLDRYTPNRAYWLINAKWRLLEAQDEPVEWMVLGDSSCNQGVRPDVLSKRLGGRVVNLCTIGDMLVLTDAWMLQRAVDEGRAPRNVVIVHAYDVWRRPVSKSFRRLLMPWIPLRFGFWADMRPPISMSRSDQRALLYAQYMPMWSENAALAHFWQHPGALRAHDFVLDPDGYMRSDVVNLKGVRSDNAGHLHRLRQSRATLSPVNLASLEEIRKVSDAHDIHVYIASAPLYEALARSPYYQRYHAELVKALEAVAAGSPRWSVVLRDSPTFRADQMENVDHVNHEAAGVYSERLAEAIAGERSD